MIRNIYIKRIRAQCRSSLVNMCFVHKFNVNCYVVVTIYRPIPYLKVYLISRSLVHRMRSVIVALSAMITV